MRKVACCLSVCPAAETQTGRQTDSEKTVSVCESHCEGTSCPEFSSEQTKHTQTHTHARARTHTHRQASQCTQESAVKYQGEALTHTRTGGGLDEVYTHTHTHAHTHIFSHTVARWAGDVHTQEWKRCVTCLWKSVRTAGVGKHTLDHSTFRL